MNYWGGRDVYRKLAQFHENEQLVARVRDWKAIAWFTSQRRRRVLFIGALCAGIVGLFSRYVPWQEYRHAENWLVSTIAFAVLLALVYLLYLAAKRFPLLPAVVQRRPQISFHLLFWLLLLVVWIRPDGWGVANTVIALIAVSFPYLIWRCGYMLMSGQRRKAAGTRFRDHLFYIWPIWDGTNTPPGKGHDFLSQAEAKDTAAYARSFLAGIKLLLLVLVWKFLLQVIGALVYGDPKSSLTALLVGYHLEIPRAKFIVNGTVVAPLLVIWISLYMELVWDTLALAAKGHVWVGIIRIFGFNIFRNTYKPLLAESILEFWSRYYYYFKELMMEFFFLPTYLRYFRQQPRLRIVVAIFAAAFAGNMYYHLLQAKHPLIEGDVATLWQLLGARLVYCFLLAAGIAVSMLRQQRQRGRIGLSENSKSGIYRFGRITVVWTFFSIINFWNITAATTIPERARLFLSLFGW